MLHKIILKSFKNNLYSYKQEVEKTITRKYGYHWNNDPFYSPIDTIKDSEVKDELSKFEIIGPEIGRTRFYINSHQDLQDTIQIGAEKQ